MSLRMAIPAAFEDTLTTAEQIEWLYRHKEALLTAGANINITRQGDNVVIEAVGEGFSPVVQVETIPGGHRVTITDGTGPHAFDVMDGVDGTDGSSVTAVVETITGGHKVTITDKNGSYSFNVMDGADGTDGTSAYVKSTEIVEGGVNVTFHDGVNGDTTIFLANGPQGLTGPQGATGAQGLTGATGATGATPSLTASATVNSSSGIPGVTVTRGGTDLNPTFAFAFTNLKGDAGTAATVTVGTTTTGAPGSSASVENVGTNQAAILNFTIPTGQNGTNGRDGVDGQDGRDGVDGAAATIAIGSTTTGQAGTSASVTNSGTSSAAVLDFVIPRGADGSDGQDGTNGRNTFIKYSATEPASDSDMKDVIDDWIGVYNGIETSAPAHYTDYQWFNIKGDTGATGANGAYCWIKYSATEPTQDSDMKDTADAWMGVYAGDSQTAPTAYTSYTWYRIKGADGQNGTNGQDGAAATIAVGTVTTGAAGSAATVTNTGTSSAAVFDFSIPQGAAGSTGPAGPGVPTGGTAGQVLSKVDGTDYNTQWTTPSGGGDVVAGRAVCNYTSFGAIASCVNYGMESSETASSVNNVNMLSFLIRETKYHSDTSQLSNAYTYELIPNAFGDSANIELGNATFTNAVNNIHDFVLYAKQGGMKRINFYSENGTLKTVNGVGGSESCISIETTIPGIINADGTNYKGTIYCGIMYISNAQTIYYRFVPTTKSTINIPANGTVTLYKTIKNAL